MRTIQSVLITGSPRQIEQLASVINTLFNSPVNILRDERPVIVMPADIEQVVRGQIRDAQLEQEWAA